jgi:hypothetical protein
MEVAAVSFTTIRLSHKEILRVAVGLCVLRVSDITKNNFLAKFRPLLEERLKEQFRCVSSSKKFKSLEWLH